MLTKKDLQLVSQNYFVILKQTKYYIEILSKSTGHCWTIYKHGSPDKYPVWIYHKHHQSEQCYHLHRRKGSVKSAVKEIYQHDKFQLSRRKNVFSNVLEEKYDNMNL